MTCEKCERLMELYERTPKEPRDYWLMTEIFVALHGGDECKELIEALPPDEIHVCVDTIKGDEEEPCTPGE